MKKTVMLLFALLCMVAQGAWADSTFGGGDGSAKNPYIIKTDAHWNQFASDVNGGNTYSDKYFLLDADITVSTMVGAGTTGKNCKPFSGTFDGGGHTLTFSYNGSGDDIAPFRFIRNALITNLHMAGEITTSGRHAGGLAGRTYGTTRIVGCRVSTVINSSHSGDGTHGGIVALKPDWSSAKLTIEGCVYDGKIVTTNGTTLCGGFVGYTSYGSLTIKNSIYAPAATTTGETAVSSEKTFYRYSESHPGTITLTNCYYFQTLGGAQGKHARSIGFEDGIDINVVPTGNATEYGASGITGYDGNQCVKYLGTVYAGIGDEVKLTFNHHYVGCDVYYSIYDAPNERYLALDAVNGVYTVAMSDADVTLAAQALPSGGVVVIPTEVGSEEYPYLITDATSWDYFVSLVNKGEAKYASAYYKLTADITVTTMMGNNTYPFKGHFDGGVYDDDHNLTGYHTLTVGYTTSDEYAAPFRYVDGAEFSNLRVAGIIRTSKKFAGGFIANSKGTTSITNCRSSVTINSSFNGDGTHGGFVAFNTGGTLTITGCTFDGYMLGGNTNNCAGFVGWNETNNNANGKVTITNSLFAPKGIEQVIQKTFVRSRDYATTVINITNSHCTAPYDNDQQSRIYSITADENVSMTYSGTNPTAYNVSGLTTYTVGLKFDGVLYAKNGDQLSLTLTHTGKAPNGSVFSGFDTTAGTLSGESNPYTITMTNANATIFATYETATPSWTHGGNGTSGNPYIISNSDEWNEFVSKVNSGMAGFATAYYQLAGNITVTSMVGTEGYKFKGHFNGAGYTMTLSYGTSGAPFDEDYCAPFRYIEGADIRNLTVDGTIYTKKQFAAGIVGCALNNNAITDCRSSVIINSSVSGDGTHGGFVANCQNNADDATTVTFTSCAFDGELIGTTNSWGGFVGWTEGHDWAGVKFVDCIFAPFKVNVDDDGSATFSRGRYNNSDRITVENSYYTQSLGTMQGEMAYTTQPTNVTTVPMTSAGVTVYVKKALVTNVAATNITPTEATVKWTGTEACSNYKVRYRVKKNSDVYSTSFEDGLPEGWTTFNNDDDDEFNWTHEDGTKRGMALSGNACMYSASYINQYGAVEPDNWLVTEQLTLGGTMKVWLKGQDEDEYREHFAIYLSTAGGSKNNFLDAEGKLLSTVITLVPETETSNIYQEYTADLSAYNGKNQTGYIAIRHFNCYDEFYLVLDDFSIYNDNGNEWTVVSGSSPDEITLTGLAPDTKYEYHVEYKYGGNTFYTSTATLTTLNDNVTPTDLSATSITANTATISWKGFGSSYNVRYGKGGQAKVTLSVPNDVWGDGSGYQMLLDANHNTYGTVIPETGGLTTSGDAPAATYAEFEYKIPTDADGALDTPKVVDGDKATEVTITIPAGTYDWCITNPSPNDRVWIASENGNVGGRQDDFVFEAGKHYTFTVMLDDGSVNDCVNMTFEVDATLAQGDVTTVDGIIGTSYTLGGLTAQTNYTVYVQSVKGSKESEWSSLLFTTTDATSIGLLNDDSNMAAGSKNTAIIEANDNQNRKVTLAGRTLYKDGKWNTLCLPFDIDDIANSPLANYSGLMTLDVTSTEDDNVTKKTRLVGTTLYLWFKNATSIKAGVPYIIKWEGDGTNNLTETNLVFNDVKIKNVKNNVSFDLGNSKAFVFCGTYSTTAIGNTSLYLSDNNTLYWPDGTMNIRACRAYFQTDYDAQTGGGGGLIREFILNFDEDTQGIKSANANVNTNANYYDLQGRKVNVNVKKGLYIVNGKKVVIK